MEQQPKQSYTDFMQEPSPAPSSPPPGSPSRAPRSSEQKQVITIVAVLAVVVAFVLVSCLILFHNNGEDEAGYIQQIPTAYESTYRAGLLSSSICKIYAQTWDLAQEEGLDTQAIVDSLADEVEASGYLQRIQSAVDEAEDALSDLPSPGRNQQQIHEQLLGMKAQLDILSELALHPEDLDDEFGQEYQNAYNELTNYAAQMRELLPELPNLNSLESDIMFPIVSDDANAQ